MDAFMYLECKKGGSFLLTKHAVWHPLGICAFAMSHQNCRKKVGVVKKKKALIIGLGHFLRILVIFMIFVVACKTGEKYLWRKGFYFNPIYPSMTA